MLFLALIIASTLLLCHGQVGPGPGNITREEGEDNVAIHCPFSATSAPIWRINSTLYEPLSLTQPFRSTVNGLVISTVQSEYNQTTFQCFVPNGVQELGVQASSVGVLTVTKNDDYAYVKNALHAEIILDHQRMVFNATHKTIAWKLLNNQYCTAMVIFTVHLSTCDCGNELKTWTTQQLEISLSSLDISNENTYLRLSANNSDKTECVPTSAWFHIYNKILPTELSVVQGEDICIEVPKIPLFQSLYVVWSGGNDDDFICPLCDYGLCVINNCPQYDSSPTPELRPDTIYTNGIENIKYNLCWPSEHARMNNSAIYFFYEVKICDDNTTQVPRLSRNYTQTKTISVWGPPLPPAENITGNSICFTSYSYYPIDYFIVKITDSINDTKIENYTHGCVYFPQPLFPADCSPYHLRIWAHNRAGSSNSSDWVYNDLDQNSTEEESCLCIKDKVYIGATQTQQNLSMIIHITIVCKVKESVLCVGATIQINNTNSSTPHNKIIGNFKDKSLSVNFTDIQPHTSYNITVIWDPQQFSSPKECFIKTIITPPSNNSSSDTISAWKIVGLVLLPVSVISIGIAISVFILFVYILKKKSLKCPDRQENTPLLRANLTGGGSSNGDAHQTQGTQNGDNTTRVDQTGRALQTQGTTNSANTDGNHQGESDPPNASNGTAAENVQTGEDHLTGPIDQRHGAVGQEIKSKKRKIEITGPIEDAAADRLFNNLAEEIGDKYKYVGLDLGLPYTDLTDEVDKHHTPRDKAMTMLQVWKRSTIKDELTYSKLNYALKKNGLNRSADKYCYTTA